MTEPMFGMDPELFIQHGKSARSAHKLRRKSGGEYRNTATAVSWTRDGVAVEYNTAPDLCRDYAVPSLGTAIQDSLKAVRATWKTATLSSAPRMRLRESDTVGAPKDVTMFGCNPDYDAYTGLEKAPYLRKGDLMRYTGGHIHLGFHFATTLAEKRAKAEALYKNKHCNFKGTVLLNPFMNEEATFEFAALIATMCDYHIGLPFVALLGETYKDGETQRRRFYGQAGSFRNQPHGVEYRVLSGRFLLAPSMTWFALGRAKNLMQSFIFGSADPRKTVWKRLEALQAKLSFEAVQEIINTHDYVAARNNVPILRATEKTFHNDQKFYDAVVAADQKGIHFRDDVVWNWGIDPAWKYTIRDHSYWGSESCGTGRCDELIFPQRGFIKPVYGSYHFHPSTGKAKCSCDGCYYGDKCERH